MDMNPTLDDIRFFKPKYGVPSKTETGVKVKIEPSEKVKKEPTCEEMTLVKSENPEFGKNNTKENVQSATETTKKKTGKKVCKCKCKNKGVKAKVDTGLKKTGKSGGMNDKKEADKTGAKNAKRESLPGEKSTGKNPWK